MIVECKCGYKITMSSVKIKLETTPGVPIIPIQCPNCHRELMNVTIDMSEETFNVLDKNTKATILSFKDETHETSEFVSKFLTFDKEKYEGKKTFNIDVRNKDGVSQSRSGFCNVF